MKCRDAIHRVLHHHNRHDADAMNRVPTICRDKEAQEGKQMRTFPHRVARPRRLSPRAIRIGLIGLGVILLIDLITVRFSAQVQSALTLPRAEFNNSAVQLPAMKPVATTGISSTAKTTAATSTPGVKTTTASLPPVTMLAQDTFQRPDQQFWGVASDGENWAGDAAKTPAFAIVNRTGRVTGTGSAIYDSVLGKQVADSEVLFSGSVSHF